MLADALRSAVSSATAPIGRGLPIPAEIRGARMPENVAEIWLDDRGLIVVDGNGEARRVRAVAGRWIGVDAEPIPRGRLEVDAVRVFG